MEITVQYTGQLAGIAGVTEERAEVADDALVPDLVRTLCERHGSAFGDLVTQSDGQIRPSTLVILDGEQSLGDVSRLSLAGVKTVLLMTPIAGG